MNRRRLPIVIALVALGLLLVFTRGFGLFGNGQDGALKLYGNVDIREVDMAFRVGGRIAGIAAEEGDKVRKGQTLATLERTSLGSRVDEAEARVAQAQAQLARLRSGSRSEEIAQARARVDAAAASAADAEQDATRRQALVESGAISRDLWAQTIALRDRARAQLAEVRQALALAQAGSRKEDIAAGEAQLQAARAARSSATTDLGDSALTAPVGATVVTRAREPGAIVQPGETVMTLAIDRPMRVRAYIDESALSRISPGMAVTLTADGNPKSYHGKIGYISPRAEFTPKSVETETLRTDLVYRLRIVVTDPDDGLRQGQPVTVMVPNARPAGKD